MIKPEEAVIAKLTEWFASTDVVVILPSIAKASALFPGGAYRNVTLAKDTEFFVRRVRLGAKDNFIFELEPVAGKPQYIQIEMQERDMIKLFQTWEADVTKALGAEGKTWGRAKGAIMREAIREMERKRKEVEETTYGKNSMWGIF